MRMALLLLVSVLVVSACGGVPLTAVARASTSGRFIYAAGDDGAIRVYDTDHGHRLVNTTRVFSPCCADVRGATAAAPTHRFYVMYNRDLQGHLAAVDLLTNRVLWDKVLHRPGVERGNITRDGKAIYIPTWQSYPDGPSQLVDDTVTGDAVA